MITLICYDTTRKAVILKEPDGRYRVYKYDITPADILAYNLSAPVKNFIRLQLNIQP